MRIIPIRGTEIDGKHAPGGVPVDASDAAARELLSFGLATRAPVEPPPLPPAEVAQPAAAAPVIETAAAPAAPERAAPARPKNRRA